MREPGCALRQFAAAQVVHDARPERVSQHVHCRTELLISIIIKQLSYMSTVRVFVLLVHKCRQ